MTDLFEKLNVLLRSGLRDLVGSEQFDLDVLRRALTPERMGKNLDAEVAALRERVNAALDYEDELKARVDTLTEETLRLDAQADEAVANRQHEQARAFVEQLQRAQQRLAIAESDLRAHRSVTQELIQRVNFLEATVADAKHRAAPDSTQTPTVADVLREAREQSGHTAEAVKPSLPAGSPTLAPIAPTAVEDDLERRRKRLSKP
jgi:chromosome segregation ATPase